jgi:hypothetical protein
MSVSVLCNGCGHKLIVRDELVGKRIKCPQCDARFVAEVQAAPDHSTQKKIDKIFAQWPVVVGIILLGAGLVLALATYNLPSSGMFTRAGLGLMGGGIASIGYWALSSSNKDYNF